MKKSRFTEEQIIGILREAGTSSDSIESLCRTYAISSHTFYRWRHQFGGLEVKEATRLKQLEAANLRLKKLLAEQALDISILKEINAKKW